MADSSLSACPGIIPNDELCSILADVRTQLTGLEGRVAAEHTGELDTVLDVTETVLRGLGWQYPEPLTEHDRAVLTALGCPA